MQDLRIALVQTTLAWENAEENRQALTEKLDSIESDIDLVILPEMFSTGFSMATERLAETMEGDSIKWMAKQAREKNTCLVGSLIIQEEGQYFNRLIWMPPGGRPCYYDKRHLFSMAAENQHFSPGTTRLIVPLKGWRICPLVCYDLRFPVWSRNVFDEELDQPAFDCLLYVANWPEARRSAWQTLLQARAHENQCYVAGVNRVGEDGNGITYVGDSIVIGPKGEVLEEFEENKEGVRYATLSGEALLGFREKFPVIKDADTFSIDTTSSR